MAELLILKAVQEFSEVTASNFSGDEFINFSDVETKLKILQHKHLRMF